jgi:hypothetical protein
MESFSSVFNDAIPTNVWRLDRHLGVSHAPARMGLFLLALAHTKPAPKEMAPGK